MYMNNSQEFLSSVLKTTQLGQTGIRSVLDKSMAPGLSAALREQLRELNTIETEAHAIASQRGWELPELDIAVRFMSDRRNRMKLKSGDNNSGIADLMIQSNAKGMVQGLKQLHRYPQEDRISILSQKLIDCQTAAIRQLEPYL